MIPLRQFPEKMAPCSSSADNEPQPFLFHEPLANPSYRHLPRPELICLCDLHHGRLIAIRTEAIRDILSFCYFLSYPTLPILIPLATTTYLFHIPLFSLYAAFIHLPLFLLFYNQLLIYLLLINFQFFRSCLTAF